MASVKRRPRSPFWIGCVTINGKQYQRSTRQKSKKAALEIAFKWERPWQQKLGEVQIRRVVADLYEIVRGEQLTETSTRSFLTAWLARKKIETKPNTWKKYQAVVNQFLRFLGDRADSDLGFLTSTQIADFRDELVGRLTSATANLAVKILRVAFNQAFRDGFIQASPASQVTTISRKGEKSKRRGFTLPEVQRLLAIASDEWRGLIFFAFFTGQRLKDIATLTHQNVDLDRDEVRLVTSKTGRLQIIPLASPLRRYIEENLLDSDDPAAPLFPKVFADVERTGDVRRLSAAFYELLVAAGLARPRSRKNTGRGRSVKRETSELSFHSIRHSVTSLLSDAGTPGSVVMDLVGHDTPQMTEHYTHSPFEAKRRAIERMPDITSNETPIKRSKRRVR